MHKTIEMKNIIIENTSDQMILRINKKGFNQQYLIALIKRLQIEELAQKGDFKTDIFEVAEDINVNWWKENGESFLENVKK